MSLTTGKLRAGSIGEEPENRKLCNPFYFSNESKDKARAILDLTGKPQSW